MAFYDLDKSARAKIAARILSETQEAVKSGENTKVVQYFGDEDTYIRKNAYLSLGKLYKSEPKLLPRIQKTIIFFLSHDDFKCRQTAVNAAGEIGKTNFEIVAPVFDKGLFDEHHSVRNAVIGSIKKMGEANPVPVLAWAKKYLHHADKEIRREICHGIELRGRKYPQDILPLLKELQFDKTARVRNTLVHVLGQIAYKKGCLAVVIEDLKTWENRELVQDALVEIIDVHDRYKDFAVMTQKQAIRFISESKI